MVSNKRSLAAISKKMVQWGKHSSWVALCCVLFIFASCDRHVVFEKNIELAEAQWNYRDTLVLEAVIADTVSLHNMYVNVRNTTDYPFSNLFLFLDIRFPDGTAMRDTLEMILADPAGRWSGKGVGRVKANRFLFRTDVWFPQAGVYTFTMQQAMRVETLRGLSDVGLRISKQ